MVVVLPFEMWANFVSLQQAVTNDHMFFASLSL